MTVFWSEVSTKIHSCAPVVCVCSRLGVRLMECDSANILWREKTTLQSYCMTWHFLVLSCFSFQSFFLFCLQMNISNVPTAMIYAHVLLIKFAKNNMSQMRNTKKQIWYSRRGHRASTPYRPETANGSYCTSDVSGVPSVIWCEVIKLQKIWSRVSTIGTFGGDCQTRGQQLVAI